MPGGSELYLEDILEAIRRIELYTASMTEGVFLEDLLVQDGVTKNLVVIGEAVKKLPDSLRDAHPQISWKKIAGLRDILVHEYASVDLGIVWDVVIHRIPGLKAVVLAIRGPNV
jgi:uncharacterized protein with HEPN domain